MTLEFTDLGEPYLAVARHYSDRTAKRSGVPLINHIHEGVRILRHIQAPKAAQQAFCLHPLVQSDGDLYRAMRDGSLDAMPARAVILALEYRWIANRYLSEHCRGPGDSVRLSVLPEVNKMLIADKVQNRADFEKYHQGVHENSALLTTYFGVWLRNLGVSEESYRHLAGAGKGLKPCNSPYCECQPNQCSHPGCFDARGT